MSTPAERRRATNLSLDGALLEEARTHGVNVSRAAETGLREAVRRAKSQTWARDNAAAIESSNAWVEEHGLPLERHRPF